MEDHKQDAESAQVQAERAPRPSGWSRGVVRFWTWVLWIMAVGLWFVQMRFVGFSKPEHNDMDPVSAAGYNHQQNLDWAYDVFWVAIAPLVAAMIWALMAGRDPLPGRRAWAAAFGAFLGAAAMAGFGLYRSIENFHFVF